ncbi:MAG: hypothetical protein ABIO70_07985 [Pseudomonadota bacterium]
MQQRHAPTPRYTQPSLFLLPPPPSLPLRDRARETPHQGEPAYGRGADRRTTLLSLVQETLDHGAHDAVKRSDGVVVGEGGHATVGHGYIPRSEDYHEVIEQCEDLPGLRQDATRDQPPFDKEELRGVGVAPPGLEPGEGTLADVNLGRKRTLTYPRLSAQNAQYTA